jgi:hypothetical protein
MCVDDDHVSTPHPHILYTLNRLYEEKSDLVLRLDAIYANVRTAASLIERVRLKIEWMEERDTVVRRLTQMVSDLSFINDGCQIIAADPMEIEMLKGQLYKITDTNLVLGFIHETSLSESGHSCWFSSMDI